MSSFKNNIDLLMKMKRVSRNENLNCNEIKSIQKKKLQKLLRHVLTYSKFYKEFYRKRHITIETVDFIELEDLPIIDKKIVMENYDDLVCDEVLKKKEMELFIQNPANRFEKYLNKYRVLHSSGSGGEIGISVFNNYEWNVIQALSIKRTSNAKLSLFNKVKNAYIGAIDGSYAGMTLTRETPKLICDLMPININLPVKDIAMYINNFQPDIITGNASGVYMLAQEQINGNIKIKPYDIICSGDVLTDTIRKEIKKAFGIEPTNVYSASEALTMAAECKTHHKVHLFNDYYCFEVVDKDLNLMPNGSSGNLVMTNLYNYTQPLIRYKMNDEIIIDNNMCECGSPFPVLKNILGKQEEFMRFEKSDGISDFIDPLVLIPFELDGLLNKMKIT